MNEVTILLPAWNEAVCLDALIASWQQYSNELVTFFNLALHIVIINDGSIDATHEIGARLEHDFANVTLVDHPCNMGLGAAVKTGIKYVLENRKNSIFTCIMDCDNTHDPKYIVYMLAKQRSDNADIVIASRYQKGARALGVSKLRVFTSECARCIYSLILHIKNVRDYTCGYRLYSREILMAGHARFGDELVSETGFACMAELLYKLYACGARISEVPFILRYDFKKGTSKMRVIKTVMSSISVVLRLKKIRRQNKNE
ncbi:MAG: glycosyltransferase [Clostridia bacterium]